LTTVQVVAAQEAVRVSVEIAAQSDPDDSVGQRLVFQVREAVRRSAAFTLTIGDEPRIRLVIRTMNRLPEQPNISSIDSVVWVGRGKDTLPVYLDSTVGFAGSAVLQSSAETILARTDNLVFDLRRLIQNR
jgi:hypothetical protein